MFRESKQRWTLVRSFNEVIQKLVATTAILGVTACHNGNFLTDNEQEQVNQLPSLGADDFPVGTVALNGPVGTNRVNSDLVPLVLKASDDFGVVAYYLSEDPVAPKADDSNWYAVPNQKVLIRTPQYQLRSFERSKTIYAWFKDSASRISNTASVSFEYIRNESWKNWFAITWRSTPVDRIRFAKQMGYEYIAIQAGAKVNNNFFETYRDNPNVSGMKYYVVGPASIPFGDVDKSLNRTTAHQMSQESKSWILNNTVWKSTSQPFPNNLATGWWFSADEHNLILDFQQQAVIDDAIEKIMQQLQAYREAIRPGDPGYPFQLAGHIWDVAHLSGDFNNYCGTCSSLNQATTLGAQSGQTRNTSPIHPLYDASGAVIGEIRHEYASYEDGLAEFMKRLNARIKAEYADSKWIIEPTMLYGPTENYLNEYLRHTSLRADADELIPDMLSSESASPTETDFVDDPRNFTTRIPVLRNRVGISTANKEFYLEPVSRLHAGKAGINWAWYNWFGRWDSGTSNLVNFGTMEDLYPRLKLVRCIPNWDNLRRVPLVRRFWDETASIYRSYQRITDSKPVSFIGPDVMHSRHWRNRNKIYAVFTTKNGIIELNSNDSVISISRVNGFFEEFESGMADVDVVNQQIKLKPSYSFPPPNGDGMIPGVGFVITLQN